MERFRKICGLLASSHAGERAAAALKATALLNAAGKTWGDVDFGSAATAQRDLDRLADIYRRDLDGERAYTLQMRQEIVRLKREVARLKGLWPAGKPKARAA